ncbi:MAG: hypothetical protein QOF48_2468 [Verrucomicrobiota bacterium]
MSARKIGNSELFQRVTVQAPATKLDLPAASVRVRRNGIEFRTQDAIPIWAEMTVAMQTPQVSGKVQFNGVVVACDGNRHTGYAVSMLFTSVSKQAQARLATMAMVP